MPNKKELNNEELEKVSGGYVKIDGEIIITDYDTNRCFEDVGDRVKIYKILNKPAKIIKRKLQFVTYGTITDADAFIALGDDGITYQSDGSINAIYLTPNDCEYLFATTKR